MTKITIDGEYQLRDGKPVEILATDMGGLKPILARFQAAGQWVAERYTAHGFIVGPDQPHDWDIVDTVEERTVWINEYPSGLVSAFPCQKTADAAVTWSCRSQHKVTIGPDTVLKRFT